jgi:hypothetical protein
MSEKNEKTTPEVRPEEQELDNGALESVSGGCWVDSDRYDPFPPTLPTEPKMPGTDICF